VTYRIEKICCFQDPSIKVKGNDVSSSHHYEVNNIKRMIILITNKITNEVKMVSVFFRRVNTEIQSFDSQIAADKLFRDQMFGEEYIEVNEISVSTANHRLRDREKISEVISLIKHGRVKTLYVFDRTRLTRNLYDYLELVNLLIIHNVNVVFTSEITPKFSSNFQIESLYAIFQEVERKRISRRARDAYGKRRKIANLEPLPQQNIGK
jgi:DNA invertase Pin-like site-specific DNA recombinase